MASTDSTQAWRDFCQRLEALGDRILADDFPSDAASQAEGHRHLTRLLRLSLELHLEHGDPLYPHFVNSERPTTQWGGPNSDNFYLRARIDPNETYRIWGDVAGVEQVVFSLMEGDMHLQQFGVYSEVSLEKLEVGADGRLEIIASPDEQPGNWMPMHADASNLTIRVYQSDWANEPAPYFHIERVGAEAMSRPAPSPDEVAVGLDRSMRWVEGAVPFWNAYLKNVADTRTANELSPPHTPPGGADNISYGGGMYDLADDEALLIECDRPDADYWNVTIHTQPWFESGDFGRHQTSLNHRQTFIDDDDKFRMVLSHTDPGVPNWIDTEGRPKSMITYRWVWARSKPVPTATVVPLADIRSHLPDGHPTISEGDRAASLAARAEQIRNRFR